MAEIKGNLQAEKESKQRLKPPQKNKTDSDLLAKIQKNYSVDQGFIGSGMGALEECLRSCFRER